MSLPTVGSQVPSLAGIPAVPSAPAPQPAPPVGNSQSKPLEIVEGIDYDNIHVKMFVYGDAGSGKTLFASTAPKPLFLDTEGSTEVLRDWSERAANCKIARITWANVEAAVTRLENNYGPWSDRETVVLDTGDALQRRNLSDHVMANEQHSDPYLPMQHHYKKSGEMLVRLILRLKNLPMHVIVLSHSEEVLQQDEAGSTKARFIRPGLSPKVFKAIKQEFSLFGFMWQSEENWDRPFENKLQTRGDVKVWGKSRYAQLPPIIVNPTFGNILYAAHAFKEQQS